MTTTDELRALRDTITTGPWASREKGIHPFPYICGPEEEYEHGPDRPIVAYLPGMKSEAHSRAIALLPELMDAVIASRDCIAAQYAEIERLRAENEIRWQMEQKWMTCAEKAEARAEELDRLIHEASDPDFLWGAMADLQRLIEAAQSLLDAWDAGHVDKEAFSRLVLASSFGAQAFAVCPEPDAKTSAMFLALMQAIVDPDSPDLDYLRAKNRVRAVDEEGV